MERSKRQYLPSATLFVVATPIGNLDDISLRQKEVLAKAEVLFCEDTRQTRKLLSALGAVASGKALIRFDMHMDFEAARLLLERELEKAQVLVLVTDAGTPGISDPGAFLVRAARELGVTVSPIPGPSALTAFLSIAGFEGQMSGFGGFVPKELEKFEKVLNRLAQFSVSIDNSLIWVWFESPKRFIKTLTYLDSLGQHRGRQIVAAKELSKVHEMSIAGTAGQILSELASSKDAERGEWVFGIVFNKGSTDMTEVATVASSVDTLENARELLIKMLKEGVSGSRAAAIASQTFGVERSILYAMSIEISSKSR